MAKKVKKSSKWEDDDWESEIPVAGADATEDGADAAEAEESKAATEATEDDFMSAIKKSKSKKAQKEEDEKAKPKAGPIIKSKKEKEKEKKEAEKQRKKEIAEKKKAAADARKAAEDAARAKKAGGAPAPVDNEADKEAAPAEAAAPADEPQEEKKAAPKKKKGVPNSAIAALKKQMEMRKQLEEQARLEEEEERKREQEEEAAAAAEEAAKEAAKAAKKEKERAKKEQLKAEGKFMTKKQKEEKKLQERRRAMLLASGNVTVAALENGANGAAASKPKKVVYGSKKKRAKDESTDATPEPVAAPVVEEAAAADEIVDDWEKMALEDEEPAVEDWETALDDDEAAGPVADTTDSAGAKDHTESTANGATDEATAKSATEEGSAIEDKKESESAAPAAAAVPAATPAAVAPAKFSKKTKNAPEQDENNLRSPICCILGHVDTGKTKLLDKIRQTNVQGGEAGGITQQIGATYFPVDAIKQKTAVMAKYEKQTFDVPGLLIIDTPGHESFTNLRSRGSSLCNIAVLVIDIMHGLEQQTIESIRLLRERKAPFIVALNKIDRLYDWKETPNNSFRDSFAKQGRAVQAEFQDRLEKVKLALAEQGLNSELYFQNRNMSKYVSIVPTSAVTGEGVPDLIWLLLELTQKRMSKQLMYLSKIEATVLEVKVVEGLGTTIDVILSNGILREGDRIVICGLNGPIATNIRALLTPQPLRELRIKSEYVHHKEVKAALGVKIAANDLEKAVAGSRLLVVGEDDDEDDMLDEVMDDLTGLLDSVDKSGRGVTVQASTLGSLEALLDFLKDMKIPVMSIGLGPVYKRDVMKATTMLEKAKEYAVMLCFDVKIDKEAEQYAEEQNIKIFSADIIYHLFDAFTEYQQKLLEQRRVDFLDYAVFPCVLKTIQIINKRNPMIIGVDVVEGTVRIGTPICAVKTDPTTKEKQILLLGRVSSLEVNHKSEQHVKKGQTAQGVAMRLENPSAAQPVWGRHLDDKDTLYSLITRRSIDTLKDPAFRDTVPREDWVLIKQLKAVFDIK